MGGWGMKRGEASNNTTTIKKTAREANVLLPLLTTANEHKYASNMKSCETGNAT